MERAINYAVNDGVHIAYTVMGDGPVDVVHTSGAWSNLDLMWEDHRWARHLDRLASFCRLIVFDMPGVGLSDRRHGPPLLETQMDDMTAVMSAAGSGSAVVYGGAWGAAMSMLFAATHPERTTGLILYAATARSVRGAGYPYGRTTQEQLALDDHLAAEMGTGRNLDLLGPSGLDDPAFRRWWARFERLAASPSAFQQLAGAFRDLDIRAVVPAIQSPTLVLHRVGDKFVPAEHAGYLAASIPDARLAHLVGDDHLPFLGDSDAIADEIEEFVTGTRPVPEADRLLSTVLFTDIVNSTQRQVELGDDAWRDLVLAHHAVVRESLGRWRGVENDTAGDGFYATFDGPARAVRCALEVAELVRGLGIEIRAGVHTGPCQMIDRKCGGIAVATGARIAALAGPSQVLVSQTVRDLVAGSGLVLADRGPHTLKGVPGTWQLFEATC